MFQNLSSSADCMLDLSGLRCPVPVLRLKKHVKELAGAWCVHVKTTDPDSVRDFQEFARLNNYGVNFQEDKGAYFFTISSGDEK